MQDQIETIGMLLVKGVLLPIVGLAITAASLYLPMWIKSKVKNESVGGVLERLTALAFTVVSEVQQTVVSGLGDKATKEELLKARDLALANLKTHLGPKGIKELMTVLGISTPDGLDKLIITYIESAVHNLKLAPKPGVLVETTTTTPSEPTPA
jgi:hypothetical protein